MKNYVMQICALSIFCGLALSLTPEGSVKRMTGLCCMLLLLISVLTAFRSFDYSSYSLELARYRELGHELAGGAEESSSRLERRLIEQECAAYILRQADSLGIKELSAAVKLRWDSSGVWVPESARMIGSCSADQRTRLQALIAADLGIDDLHQEWIVNET